MTMIVHHRKAQRGTHQDDAVSTMNGKWYDSAVSYVSYCAVDVLPVPIE